MTTRRRDDILHRKDVPSGTGRNIVEVGEFTPEEALAYLTDKLDDDPARLVEGAELAEELGSLPLALAQAAPG